MSETGPSEDEIIHLACQRLFDLSSKPRPEPDKQPDDDEASEIIDLLHYAYWAIRKKSISPKDIPYRVSMLWPKLESIIGPIAEAEMAAKGRRFRSLVARGIDPVMATHLAWHNLVDGESIDDIPDDILLSIPNVGPSSVKRLRVVINPLGR